MSRESKVLIEIGNIFHPMGQKQENLLSHSRTFEHWKPFEIGPFTITSYLTDHSAFGASSLLVEIEGNKLFYTGDIRGHGRKGKLLEHLLKNPIPDVDCLLMEGTTLSGSHDIGCHTENDVEQEMHQVFSAQTDASFIIAAGSNVDRTVSIYKAAKRARKTLVLDLYQFYLLNQLKAYGPGLPPHPGDEIRVLYLKSHADSIVKSLGKHVLYEYAPRKIERQEIVERRQNMLLRIPLSEMHRIARHMEKDQPLSQTQFVYSMWHGYLESNPGFRTFCEKYEVPLIEIHTSGHAYLEDLSRLAKALQARVVLPIHTLSGDDFANHFENVVRIDDGEIFDVPTL